MTPKVDHTALKVNQAAIIGLLILAFIFNAVWLVAFVALVMLVGTVWPGAGLFKLVYGRGLRPLGWLKPDIRTDDPQPHLFAQGVGGIVLLLALVGFALGSALTGWGLVIVVVVLAAVNLFFAFCLGCFIYFQLARRGVRANLPSWG
ncbi:MAG: DUF4395 domain-containing protein [Caldilineaceae bacterium]|nr:DUF4395 domain-containing protein [Caldilineaceae bacterium]MBP8108605.1 DUF4395 domain-containing protein [Caldilineaceae bacterium]MBP8121283.1 DUF4395 domain-containing protein [Caldilineaceae bacterium]MBP9070849.1 DUF4395 domain-containing protein [Caldilineaceae bacterium]